MVVVVLIAESGSTLSHHMTGDSSGAIDTLESLLLFGASSSYQSGNSLAGDLDLSRSIAACAG